MKFFISIFLLTIFLNYNASASSHTLKHLVKSSNDYKEYSQDKNILDSANPFYGQPEQIHLSYGQTPNQMMVTWVTLDLVNDSVVEYGMNGLNQVANGTYTVFRDGGSEHRTMNIHRVLLDNLVPGQSYRYHCGSPIYGWSPIFFFTAMSDDPAWSPRFAIYGDLGNINPQSMTRLQEETALGYYDAVLHVGDFAYDMDTDNARIGDAFLNQAESIAGYLAYMTCPGNHEGAYNFSNYVYKFSMPGKNGDFGKDNNHFYSVNIGPVHVIGFSTEFYYYVEYGFKQIPNQFHWLEQDLIEANKPENRAKQPWIITMGHRPMYCTNADNDDCTKFDDRVRKGFPFINAYGLEKLFYKYGVDIELWAHEHSYERLWPIYDYVVYNGSYEEPYRNPGAPIHLVTGSAGCQEEHDGFGALKNFTAFRADDYGFTRMQVFNTTHLYFEQVSDDQDGKVIDSAWVIKDKHGPYSLDV